MKNSILKKLQIYMLGFGIAMGFVFPIYANFFVDWKEGMFPFFAAGCLLAGLTVGLVSFWFVKAILLKKLKDVSKVANDIKHRNLSNTISIESNDDVGTIVNGLNQVIENLRELFEEMMKVFSISEQALSNVNSSGQNQQSAIEKINYAITDVTNHTSEIEQLSDDIAKNVTKGKQISECTFENQKGTISQVKHFSEIIDTLVQHSNDITNVLLIIEDMSSR